MKVKTVLISCIFILGILLASCSASTRTCPAYAQADTEQSSDVRN